MTYTNLTDAQVLALVDATHGQFNGMDQLTLLRFADVLAGIAAPANTASINKLNAWGTALATKLNNDAGVTDTNYATNPQA